jgi:hypothetical protein
MVSMKVVQGLVRAGVEPCRGRGVPPGDIDVVDVTPHDATGRLAKTAGEGSDRHRRHKVYLRIVTVASLLR